MMAILGRCSACCDWLLWGNFGFDAEGLFGEERFNL